MTTTPDYTDTARSRRAMHDACATITRTQYVSKLEPEPETDPFGFDIRTGIPWKGRDLWDIKIQDGWGVLRIAWNAWRDYQNNADVGSLFIVVGTHRPPDPIMLIPFEDLIALRPPLVKLPSGDDGFAYTFSTEQRRGYSDMIRELYEHDCMNDPTDLINKLRCTTCKQMKDVEEFARNASTRRGRQANCRVCDHERVWLPEDDPRRRV